SGFLKNLELLLSDKKTKEKFAPFKAWMELDGGRQAALAALQLHAKYQRDLYESERLFQREPYALKNIYVNTECGKLLWREIRGARDGRAGAAHGDGYDSSARLDPFSENHGGRHDLLETVMSYLEDRNFNEPVVIQGVAGAGKSSFTLRLSSELWAKGFQPIRIPLKRLHLSSSLYDAMNSAIELADPRRVLDLPIVRPDDLLLKGEIFNTPHGGDHALCRYVVILDGWDELDLSDSKSFREKVGEMLREVRRVFLDPQRKPRVRVVITGRPSPDVTDSKFLNDDTPVLTMRPIRPDQLRKFVDDLDDAVGMTPPYVEVKDWEAWRVPYRTTLEEAFKKYEEAFNRSLPEYDEQGKIKHAGQAPDSASLEVLGLPLLAYLTMRVMAEVVADGGPLEEQQKAINEMIESPTLLYRRLTDLTCLKAGKAQLDERDRRDEIEQQARETGDRLRERLRRTAAAMSVLGVEHISRAEWEKRVPPEKDRQTEERTQVAEDHPLSRLMISFYFKGGQPEQGCEFAHKSFREYLFAECIVETMKAFGRGLTKRDVERWPKRNFWRDFSPEEDRDRFEFSRSMAELLAPIWFMPSIWGHLHSLIEWEIYRSFTGEDASLRQNRLTGLPTLPLTSEEWRVVRDGLASLWDWWGDRAHLRQQVKMDRRKGAVIELAFVEELIRWASPLTAEVDETLPLENFTSLDSHLGDALCQLTAMAHFHVAECEGWNWREAWKYKGPFGKAWNCQQRVRFEQNEFTLFAPGNRPNSDSDKDYLDFDHFIARINSAFNRPQWNFPGGAYLAGVRLIAAPLDGACFIGASLDGAILASAGLVGAILDNASLVGVDLTQASLDGARFNLAVLDGAILNNAILDGGTLDDASLVGVSLIGASLDRTRLDGTNLNDALLDGAMLYGARYLTIEQIESARIDEETELPEEFEHMKFEILEKQRQRRQAMDEGDDVEFAEPEEAETDFGDVEADAEE
ncbi:MAG: pentapeptide repeat-containing protein, partial [Acidobacteriota bacterium]